jgi:AmmeMemoRadiSam system protein B
MMVREPIVAGRFYAALKDACESELNDCLADRDNFPIPDGQITGGVVPHAGWICSGSVAAKVFHALAKQGRTDTVVILGAAHRLLGPQAVIFPRGAWETPLGQVAVDDRLADRLMGLTNLIDDDPRQHEQEHSIEVQLPFVQQLLPDAKILPIIVPPSNQAPEVGKAIGRAILAADAKAAVIGSSDLTHYGPSYAFTPQGTGRDGISWAKDQNDKPLLDLIENMDADAVVPEVQHRRNACGAGAIAAAIAASAELGASRGRILEHTTSFETLLKKLGPTTTDSVGYAAAVFLK